MTTVKIKIWLALFIIGAIQTYYLNAEVRIVCYYTNWSVYRPGTAKFNPQNINPYLCTHLIYAFGGFTKDNTLKPFDKYQDIEKGGYAKFTGLKTYNKNLKTLIAIGGWNEGSSRFSSLAANSEKRKEFVKNVVKFLRVNHFDGLDLDWEYPSFRDGGKPHDKENYCQLVQDLREEFEREAAKTGRPKLLLTMAVPAGIEYIKKGFDVEKLNKYLDWMNILSYDYHSAFEPSVNHHAPLYPLEEESEYNYDADLNIEHTIKYYLEAGADRQKLVLGIPTYGRSYTLFNPDANEIGAPADGPGEMGDATKEKGYLAYYEICENINSNSGWTVVQPNPNAMGPYAYKEDQWVGYDDENIVRLKAKYVAEQDLGGIMFWSIDNDDFRGKCHGRPYPLIEAAKEALIESSSNSITSEERVVTRYRTRPSTSKNIQTSEIVQNSGGRQTITQTTVLRSRGGNRFNSRNQNQFDDEKESTVIKGSNRRRVTNSRSKQNQRRQSQRRSTTTTSTTTTTTTSAPLSVITPSYTTPPPPATPDAGGEFKCEDEGFYPHPTDCKKYYWCLSSGPSELGIVAHQFTCPAGLYFNKAADSCDYSRNVLCNKKLKTTTTTTTSTTTTEQAKTTQSTTTPRTTTQRTRAPITAATSKTTLRLAASSTTTPIPDVYEDDEYEYYDDDEEDGGSKQVFDSEEDPKVIKELIALIKKVGGVQELEKQLFSTDGNSGSTTPPAISKSLYERVLSSRNNNAPGAQFSGGSKNIFETTKTRTTNFRSGAQISGSEEESSNRGKPQYVTINRSRQRTTNDDESLENIRTNTNYNSEESLIQTNSNSNSQLPSYVTIARGTKTKLEQSSTSEESPNEPVLRNKEQRRNQLRTNSEMPEYVTIARGSFRAQQNENVNNAEEDSSDEEELNVKTTFNSGSERRFVNRLETVKNVNMPEYVSTTNFRQRNLPNTSSELNENESDTQTIFSSSESTNLSKQNSDTSTKYQTLNRSRSTVVSSSTISNEKTETSDEVTTKSNTISDQTLLLSIKDNEQQNQKETVVITVNESVKDVLSTEDENTGTTETIDILLKPLLNIPVLSEDTNQTIGQKTVIETETSTNDKSVPLLQPARPFSITQKIVLDEQTNANTSATSTLKVSENQTTANDVVYTSRGTLLTPHGFVLGHNGSTNSNNSHINNITKIEYTIIDNKNALNYNLNETNEIKNNRVPIVRIASDNRFASRNNSRLGVRIQESENENVNETNVFNVSRNRFRIQGTTDLQSNQTETSTQSRFRNQNSTEVQSNQVETSSRNRFRVQGTSNRQFNQTEASRNRFGIRESSNISQNRLREQETSTEAQNQTETVTRNRFTGRRVVSRFRTTTTTPSPSSDITRSRNRGRVRGTLATTTASTDEEDLNASAERTYRPKTTFRDLSSLTAVDFNRRAELNGGNRFRINRRRPVRPTVTTTNVNATESGTSVNRTSTFGTRRQSVSNENESIRRTITTETNEDTASRNYIFRPRGNRIFAVKVNETGTQREEILNQGENVSESIEESSAISSVSETNIEDSSAINETSIEQDENEHIHLSETNIRETESIGREVNQIVKPIEITRRRKIIRKQRPIASTIDFTTETSELVMVDNVEGRVSVTREQSVTEPNIILRTRKVIRKLRPVNAIRNSELEQQNSTLIKNNSSSSNSNSSENLVTQQRSQTSRFSSQRNRTLSRPTQTEGTVTVQNTSRRRYQSNNINRFGTRPRLEVLRTSSSLNSEVTRNDFEENTSKSFDSKANQFESATQSKVNQFESATQSKVNQVESDTLSKSSGQNENISESNQSISESNQTISEESISQLIASNSETQNNLEARSQLSTSSNLETSLNESRSESTLSASQIETSSRQNIEYENQRLITTESEKEDATTESTMEDTTDLVSEITTSGEDIVVTAINEIEGLTSPDVITTDSYVTTLNAFEENETLTSNKNESVVDEQMTTSTTSKPSRLFRRPGERTSLNRTSFSNRRDSVISTSSESSRVNGFRRRFTTPRSSTTVNYPSTTRRRTVYRQFTPRTSTRNYSSFGNRRRNQTNEVVDENETDEYNSVNSNEVPVNLSSSRNRDESYSVRNQQSITEDNRLNKVSITANQERLISQINSGNSETQSFLSQTEFSEVNTKLADDIGISELNTESQINIGRNQNGYDQNELSSKQNNEQIEQTTSILEENRAYNTNQQEISDYEIQQTSSESNIEILQTETEDSNIQITEETNYGLKKSTSKSNIEESETVTEDSIEEITEETNYGLKKSSGIKTFQSNKTASKILTETSVTPSAVTNEEKTSSSLGIGYSKFSKSTGTSTSSSNENSIASQSGQTASRILTKTSIIPSAVTNEDKTSSLGIGYSKFSNSAAISASSSSENTNASQSEQTASKILTETSITPSAITNEDKASSLGIGYSKFSKSTATSISSSKENSKASQSEQTASKLLTETSITSSAETNEEKTSSLGMGYSKFSKSTGTSTSSSNENSDESSLLIHHVFAEPTTEYPETTKVDLIEEDGIKKNQKKLIEVNRYVEVNYKEGDTKNKTLKFGTMLDMPEMDKIGEINRVTVIKIVDGNITQTGDENLFLSETSALRNFLNSTRPVTITTKIRAANNTVEQNTQNETVNDLLTAHLQAIENALVNDDAKNGRKIRIDSQSRVANTYTLQPDFTEITTLALEALFQKDKQSTTSTSGSNDIQAPLPTLRQLAPSVNQPNELQNKLLNIKILKQDEDDSRSLKFSDDANILPIRILNDNKPEANDETKVVYLLKNSPFIDSGIKRENRSPQKGLNIKSDKMGGFLTTTKSTTLSVPHFRKNLLRRNQTSSILKKRPIVTETSTTELPTTTVNQSLQKLRNRTFKPRQNNNLLNNKANNTTKSVSNVTTTAKPNTNRFRFATRKVSVFRTTTQKISTSTERNDQDIEPSNHKSLNSKNLLDRDTVVADDIVLAIHNIQAAPIRTSVEVNRNPKNIRYRPTTVRSLPKSRLKTIDQLPIIEDDVEYEEDDTDTIKILGKDVSKGKVLIHPSGKIQCLDQGNFPHPVSCRKFISCAKMENGAVLGWEYTCPKNLSFDPIGGICNWAAGLGCVS